MNRNTFRRTSIVAAAGVATMFACATGPLTADASPATGAPTASRTGIVPPAGSGTAYGYSALVRHSTGPTDDQGKLVLLAPDGRSSTIGDVSDDATVMDVSSNARTVVTGFHPRQNTEELRLTIWDTASRKPTYLRVNDGNDVALVKDGIVVGRYGHGAQLYSRSGQLLRTYSGSGSDTVVASSDGTRVVQDAPRGPVVRDVKSGKVTRRVPVPAGRDRCWPAFQLDTSSFSMDCDDPDGGAPGESTAYRAGYTSSVKTSRLVKAVNRSGGVRRVSGELFAFDAEAGTPGSRPAMRDAAGVVFYLDGYAGSKPESVVVGAHGDSIYLASVGGLDKPAHTLQRFDTETSTFTTLAGPRSDLGGIVTSAKTVDGS